MKFKKSILFLAILVLQLFLYSFSTLGQDKTLLNLDEKLKVSKQRAQKIVADSKRAIGSKRDISQITNISLSFEGTSNYYKEIKEKNDFFISLPDKVNYKLYNETDSSSGTIVTILNGNYLTNRTNSTWQFGAQSRSDFTKVDNPEDELAKTLSLDIFEMLVPYFLEFKFVKTDEIKHVGIAEIDGGKADVLETTVQGDKVYQLIFDQKSHQLLMMVKKFVDDGKPYERNFYFTEYKLNQGLMIPHKIVMTGVSSRGTNIYVERNLKKLSLNESFDPKLFEIKDK